MIFHPEGQFQQFPHCKFRENIVRLLHIPVLASPKRDIDEADTASTSTFSTSARSENDVLHYNFLAVNKFGKVGLYHPQRFTLLHTFCLDLSVPMHPRDMTKMSLQVINPPTPKCERTHLITEAIFSPDTNCVIYATTKNILQWYDIGEIQQQNIGLEIFPRREFLGLYESCLPAPVQNKGHVESHRLFGLNAIPSSMEYISGKVFIGDVEGGITIISIPNGKAPLGRRKIRGKLHKVVFADLIMLGIVRYYKAHHHPITDILFLMDKDLILSCSKDKKFSVFVKDVTDNVDNIIVSISKGANTIAYSPNLKMIATGSDDYVIRLFSQFIMKMPQMELFGHRSPIITVQFVNMDNVVLDGVQEDNAVILLSYSADSELRAWDPMTFICLQSLYLSFPVGSTILCKTPEFAKKSLLLFSHSSKTPRHSEKSAKERKTLGPKTRSGPKQKISTCIKNDMIIILYCNSFAKILLEKDGASRWPFDYDQFIQEYEELSMLYDKKLKEKLKMPTSSIPLINLPRKEESVSNTEDELEVASASGIISNEMKLTKEEVNDMESKLDKYLHEILELKQAIRENSSSVLKGRPPLLFQDKSESSTGRLSSTTTEPEEERMRELSPPPPIHFNISVEAINKYYEFKREKGQHLPKNLRRMLSYGQAFNQYPILELQPIEFSRRNLKIPERMKTMLGIESVNSVKDLFTPEAQAYFGIHKGPEQNQRLKSSNIQKGVSSSRPNSKSLTVVGQKLQNSYEEEKTVHLGRDSSSRRKTGREFTPVLEEDEDDKSFDYS